MKWLLLGLMIVAASTARATDGEPVRIFLMTQHTRFHTGDRVPGDAFTGIMYTVAPCKLPLADARHMFHYVEKAMRTTGCWYPTIDGGYTVVLENGYSWSSQSIYLESNARGLLQSDGSVLMTEPNYDSSTFVNETQERIINELVKRRGEAAQRPFPLKQY